MYNRNITILIDLTTLGGLILSAMPIPLLSLLWTTIVVYGIIKEMHSKDITILIVLVVSVLFYQSTIVPTIVKNS